MPSLLVQKKQQTILRLKNVDLYSEEQRKKYARSIGYVKQAERLEDLASSQDINPKCRWCERLGDSIIALHVSDKETIVTADMSFVPFGTILNREVKILPSLTELKKRDERNSASDSERT